jgi:MFS family permease
METEPPKKSFWMVPFTVQVTRGLLRDERSRRRTMGISLIIAVAMLAAGLTVLRPWLNPHEHPWRFIFFWFACAWETLLVLLLALLDLLLVRAQARAARRAFREQFSQKTTPDLPGAEDQK